MNHSQIRQLASQQACRLLTPLCVVAWLFTFATLTYATVPTGAITEASFNGDYAGFVNGVGGQRPVAIAGILSFNGDGTGDAKTLWFLPGPTSGDLEVIPRDYPLTYEVDDKGIALVMADAIADLYFVVTRSRPRRNSNELLALEVQGMSGRLETSGANIVVGIGKRLPDRANFDDSSMNGVYGAMGVGDNARLATVVGYTTLKGDGTGSGQSLWNLPDPLNIFERQLIPIESTVTYTVDSNGIGKMLVDQGDGVERLGYFVVTKAKRVHHGRYIATEAFTINGQLNPVSGDLISGLVNRLSNWREKLTNIS